MSRPQPRTRNLIIILWCRNGCCEVDFKYILLYNFHCLTYKS